ncbi:MAG TPA: hypothetical protein VNO55_18445 [Polyangia bacterium]|nr:hypothetical protein [Polyangia bacterium]
MNARLGKGAAALLTAFAAFLAAAPARAQLGTGGTTGTTGLGALTADDFFIGVQGTKGQNLTDYDLLTYFNQANCVCNRATYVFAALNSMTGAAKRPYITRGNIEAWVGVSCDQPLLRPTQCQPLGSALLTNFAAQGGVTFDTGAQTISRALAGSAIVPGTGGVSGAGGAGGAGGTTIIGTGGATGTTSADPCVLSQQLSTQTIYLLVDQDADGTFEVFATKQVPIDLTAPPAPADVTVSGGNQALVANWKPLAPTDDASGILGYQILCNRANEFQVFADKSFTPGFETAATNCADTHPGGKTVESLDPAFVCSDMLSAAATSARIKILQNDIYYGIGVVAVDKHKNPSLPSLVFGKPIASLDFYNRYRSDDPSMPNQTTQPGHDSGGYCAVPPSTARGWMAVPALGLVVSMIVLAARRRRRRP